MDKGEQTPQSRLNPGHCRLQLLLSVPPILTVVNDHPQYLKVTLALNFVWFEVQEEKSYILCPKLITEMRLSHRLCIDTLEYHQEVEAVRQHLQVTTEWINEIKSTHLDCTGKTFMTDFLNSSYEAVTVNSHLHR